MFFFLNFLVLFYFITFTPKRFVLAVAPVGAKQRAAEQNLQNFTISMPLC